MVGRKHEKTGKGKVEYETERREARAKKSVDTNSSHHVSPDA